MLMFQHFKFILVLESLQVPKNLRRAQSNIWENPPSPVPKLKAKKTAKKPKGKKPKGKKSKGSKVRKDQLKGEASGSGKAVDQKSI